ncbi:hypothetical protein BC941DRAFT_421161 [Chlamydoabsidia padenii]|nr:hypothetical protein BC941DRAFT_421161 [Chlamydoabsidia padenii]
MNSFLMEYDENYVAGQHKASSTTSLDSGDHPPSLYTGQANSCSSLSDLDEPLGFIEGHNEQQQSTSSGSWYDSSRLVTQKEQVESKSLPSLDEKRVHHIASEHKRRQSIRSGLARLIEWVPHLKHNSKKSTILFKTADYIKRTQKRNIALRNRLLLLQHRIQIKQLEQQVVEQQELLLQHNIPAIIVPHDDDDDISSIPCLNIPADEEFGNESLLREQFLCCGKLKLDQHQAAFDIDRYLMF